MRFSCFKHGVDLYPNELRVNIKEGFVLQIHLSSHLKLGDRAVGCGLGLEELISNRVSCFKYVEFSVTATSSSAKLYLFLQLCMFL